MRWFPWWNRAIKRQRRDRFSSPLLSLRLSSALLAADSSWHHSDGEHTHAHARSRWSGNRELNWNQSEEIRLNFSAQVCLILYPHPPHPPLLGDLEVKRVMSLLSVGQQPSVPARTDKSQFWSPEDWNKPDRNYLVDKGRSKDKARSTDINLQHLYESHFCHRWKAEGLRVSGLYGSVQNFAPIYLWLLTR